MEQDIAIFDLDNVVQEVLDFYFSNGQWPQIRLLLNGNMQINNVSELINVIYGLLESKGKLPDTLRLTSRNMPVPLDWWTLLLNRYVETNGKNKIEAVEFKIADELGSTISKNEKDKNMGGEGNKEVSIIVKKRLSNWSENKGKIAGIIGISMNHRGYRLLLNCLLGIKCKKNNIALINAGLKNLFTCLLSDENNCLHSFFSLGGRRILLRELAIVVLKLSGLYESRWEVKQFEQSEIENIKNNLLKLGFKFKLE